MTPHYLYQTVLVKNIESLVAHMPSEILQFRSSILHTLSSEMSFILDNGGFFCRILVGSHDSGKTLISKFLFDTSSNRVLKFYVNCKMESSAYSVIARLLRILVPSIPFRGLSLTEFVDIFLEELNGRSALIVLDDVDSWLPTKNGEKLLIRLSEVESKLKDGQGIYVLITLESEKALSGLRRVNPLRCIVTKLEGYSYMQLFSILRNVAEKAFYRGCISESSLKMLTRVAAVKGLKQTLLVLLDAARYAEAELSTRIFPRHVKKALKDNNLLAFADSRRSRRSLLLNDPVSTENQTRSLDKELFESYNEALKPNGNVSYSHLELHNVGGTGAVAVKTVSRAKGEKITLANLVGYKEPEECTL
ncbi:MAG: orc1/cdc6 family replication initiation protein [Candidatus Freyarchaeota archaeon]|nr:orc1/cdc6 family replication initiation protein [Candidatus Jordarchaeia archaeon]